MVRDDALSELMTSQLVRDARLVWCGQVHRMVRALRGHRILSVMKEWSPADVMIVGRCNVRCGVAEVNLKLDEI